MFPGKKVLEISRSPVAKTTLNKLLLRAERVTVQAEHSEDHRRRKKDAGVKAKDTCNGKARKTSEQKRYCTNKSTHVGFECKRERSRGKICSNHDGHFRSARTALG